jgi:transposase InsO family protein
MASRAPPQRIATFLMCYGASYVSADLAKWLDGQDMDHVRGAPYHPMTQGKIERWHQTLKNRILLENYYLPGDLEAEIDAFVANYNHLGTSNYRWFGTPLANLAAVAR